MQRILLAALLLFFVSPAFAQGGYQVNGKVTDKNGEALPGITVMEEGSTRGTGTDENGTFTLSVSSAAANVIFSCPGYALVTLKASEVPAVVQMSEELTSLSEVVVIGYGTQRKKEVTGAVSSVKEEDFNAGVKNSPMGLLQGKVAGLTVSRTAGGDPTNTGYNIQIRGFSTLDKGAGTSPLYIVDGIPVNNIDNIAPDDIASMDVLKDGSAAAIYGTRGTNGVIIITTKRGLSGAGAECGTKTVEYSGYMSISTIMGDIGMATPDEFRNLESISGGKVKPSLYERADGATFNTDWMKEVTREAAVTHNHNVAMSGATQDFSYRASVAYKNAEGIAKNSNRNEFIAKFAANQTAFEGWLDVQYDVSYLHYRNDFFTGSFKEAAILNPSYPVYDESTANGYFMPTGTGRGNPVEQMNQKESYKDGNYFRGSVRPTINIKSVPGLKLSAFGAWEEGNNNSYWYNRTINTDLTGSNQAGREPDRNINKLFEATADYAKSFGLHRIAAVAGFSYQNFWYDNLKVSNKGFPYESLKWFQIGNGNATKNDLSVSSGQSSNTLAAMFGRVNYNYDEKYLLSASIRREGSSRFGANNKWGYFPAVSVGWRVTSEDFMKSVDWVNDLKLRFGFGVTGNNLASDLQSLPVYSNGGTFWYNNQWVYTYTISRNVNPDLRWEKKYEYNLGIDFSLLQNRLYGTVDLYMRNTKDLLWDYEVPTPPYQYNVLLANAGEMTSKGLEISVSGVAVKTADWTWTTTPTIAFNHNVITKLSDPSKGFNYTRTLTGGVGENGIMNTNTQILIENESVGTFWGYTYAGTKSDGTVLYSTPDGGYTSQPNESHKMNIGNAQPLFTFGWNNAVRYKDFDLSLFFRGVYGNEVLNITRWAYGAESNSVANNVFMKDLRDGKYTDKSKLTDQIIEDGSFLKLDNLTLGYTLPLKKNKWVNAMRAYLTVQNVFTLTKYSGIDPEVNTTGVWDAGIDYPDFYPNVRNFMLGVNITF